MSVSHGALFPTCRCNAKLEGTPDTLGNVPQKKARDDWLLLPVLSHEPTELRGRLHILPSKTVEVPPSPQASLRTCAGLRTVTSVYPREDREFDKRVNNATELLFFRSHGIIRNGEELEAMMAIPHSGRLGCRGTLHVQPTSQPPSSRLANDRLTPPTPLTSPCCSRTAPPRCPIVATC